MKSDAYRRLKLEEWQDKRAYSRVHKEIRHRSKRAVVTVGGVTYAPMAHTNVGWTYDTAFTREEKKYAHLTPRQRKRALKHDRRVALTERRRQLAEEKARQEALEAKKAARKTKAKWRTDL